MQAEARPGWCAGLEIDQPPKAVQTVGQRRLAFVVGIGRGETGIQQHPAVRVGGDQPARNRDQPFARPDIEGAKIEAVQPDHPFAAQGDRGGSWQRCYGPAVLSQQVQHPVLARQMQRAKGHDQAGPWPPEPRSCRSRRGCGGSACCHRPGQADVSPRQRTGQRRFAVAGAKTPNKGGFPRRNSCRTG